MLHQIKAANLKKGQIFTKNGFTVYFGQGRYYVSAFRASGIFGTLTEAKQHIKDVLRDQQKNPIHR